MGNDLNRTFAKFTYLKCMIMCLMKKKKWKKREENKKKKTRREKALPFFQSLTENRMWILEFACYPQLSIKIKKTISFTLMEKISTFSAIVPNRQINYYFTITFYNNVIKSHQYYTVLSVPYF